MARAPAKTVPTICNTFTMVAATANADAERRWGLWQGQIGKGTGAVCAGDLPAAG
eukprot:m.67649 g.67649  ORF g.67649 m.67649 type:complete len:55 (-) comp14126_c0_seq3:22-186(-)